MTEKELKKLSRLELLEMLLEQTKRADALEAELEVKKKELENKRLAMAKAGNIAEAALSINGVFEAAQKAAQQYLYNVEQMHNDSDLSKNEKK